MAEFAIDDRRIRYSVTGSGPPVVLTPGGRLGMDALRSTATLLEAHLQLVQWDRSDTGASDVWIGEQAEQLRWADDIALLLEHLGIESAFFIGGSAGARLAYLTAIRHPRIVRGMVLWSVSGGAYSSQLLGYQYHTPYIEAAIRAGMAAVLETQHFHDLVAANPRNRDRLLALDPDQFVAMMHGWNESFFWHPDRPVISATIDELRTITAPTLIFDGNDDFHPTEAAAATHDLIAGSELVPCAWTREEWMWRGVGRIAESVVELYPRMAPTIVDYISRTGRP
jgi:pimeloyl-ACP methyl ester carboxylesterase